jgi:acetyltransferase-like isoleucine patch superfamily enzyme
VSFIKDIYNTILYPLLVKKKTCQIQPPIKIVNSRIGEYVKIDQYSVISNSILQDHTTIGRNCEIYQSFVGQSSIINHNSIMMNAKVGNYCAISWNVTLGAKIHSTESVSVRPTVDEKKITDIGDDVWIGANVVVTPGVHIGTGAVIGASAVVTKNMPPYSIAVGIPATVIKYRFDEETRKKLLTLKWWKISWEKYRKNYDLFKSAPSKDTLNKIKEILRADHLINDG